MEPIPSSHYSVSRAAGVVMDYINCKLGGPFRLFELDQVTSSSKESIAGVGNKYQLTTTIKDNLNKQSPITCNAEVVYFVSGQNKPPKVTYTLQTEPQNYTATKDQEFYDKMKKASEPLIAENIPDKFGNVKPDMEPVLHMSLAAASCVKWQHSTEKTFFRMTVIEKVKETKRQDAALELQYNMLIHDMVSQEIIPWLIEVTWEPKAGLKIKNERQLPKKNPDANN